jgi:ribosomal protein L21E
MAAYDDFKVGDKIVVTVDNIYHDTRGRVRPESVYRGARGVVLKAGWSPAPQGDGYPVYDVRLDDGRVVRFAGVLQIDHDR